MIMDNNNNSDIYNLILDITPENRDFDIDIDSNSFIFRDESWEHINTFTGDNDLYCWNQNHNSDTNRVDVKNNAIHIISKKKENNWNCFFYRNVSAYDFKCEFSFETKENLDEIQVAFNCSDLSNRCRFMIRNCNNAVFEIVNNGIFYRYIREKKIDILPNTEYTMSVTKIGTNYQLRINNELLFSVNDESSIKFGRDLGIIVYNRNDNNNVNIRLSDIDIKVDRIYKPRIGILTYHKSHNYGAFLQAYCLCKKLNEEDFFDCEIIDYRTQVEKDNYTPVFLNKKLFNSLTLNKEKIFYTNLYNSFNDIWENCDVKISKDSLVSNSIKEFTKFIDKKYDIVIAGSDEIWRLNSFRGFPTAYWLWGNIHSKKATYAISSRSDFDSLDNDSLSKLKTNINSFSLLSFRDLSTINSISKLVPNMKIHLCPDPTFVYDINLNVHNVLQNNYQINNNKKNVLVILDNVNEKFTNKIKNDLFKEYNLISIYRYHKGFTNIGDISPFEFIELIKEADFIITNLYHAVCYCIIHNKPYLALGINDKKEKIQSLSNQFTDIQKRTIYNLDYLLDNNINDLIKSFSYTTNSSMYIENSRNAFNTFYNELKKLYIDID